MDELILKFPEQIEDALRIAAGIDIATLKKDKIYHIVVAGLGGSGIGGDFVKHFIQDSLAVPYVVSKSYSIPQFVNENTLVIISSYSGNTEETISSFRQAQEKGCQLFVISSGGELIESALKGGIPHVKLPNDYSSPRACLGYSLIQQFGILYKLGFIDDTFQKEFLTAKFLLEDDLEHIKHKAEMLADFMNGKTGVIYSSDKYEPVAIRWRQQINENAKALCWHHVVPEMNHNELVGWRDDRNDLAVIMLSNKDDHSRTQVRLAICKEIISNYTSTFMEVKSKGNSMIERAIYLVHLGDWMSFYLARKRGVDPVGVKVIEFLKGELKKI